MMIGLIAPRLRRVSGLAGATLLACVLLASTAQMAWAVTPIPTIANSGFETWSAGAPTDWYIQSGGTVQQVGSPHSGTFALSFNDPNTYPLTARMLAPGGSLTEGMPVEQYRWYRFAAWAQSDRGASAPLMIMWFTNDAGTILGTTHSVRGDQFGVNPSTWKLMQTKWQAPSGATRVIVQLGMYGGTGGIRFDDVTLDEVNAASGETDLYSGWTVQRSDDLGSGFGVNVPGNGSISFTAPGGPGYELNGAAFVSQTFKRPIESLSFDLDFSADWDDARLQPIVWSNPTVTGVPVVLEIFSAGDALSRSVSYPDLNTRHIDLTCSAVRGPSDAYMDATFSNVRALGPVWRFRNLKNGFYLWTAEPGEKESIKRNLTDTWLFEGPSYRINVASPYNQSPLWRFRNIRAGNYLYTADVTEKNYIVNNLAKTWKLEGEAYKVSTRKTDSAVWRFRHQTTGIYLYTSDADEVKAILATPLNPWVLEGKAYYLATY